MIFYSSIFGKGKIELMASKGKEQVDRLSSLPESILVRILSFLPIEDAVKTVLIRPFGDLWKKLDTLNLVDLPFYMKYNSSNIPNGPSVIEFIRFVRYFLMLQKGSTINTLRINISYTLATLENLFARNYPEMEEQKLVSEIEMWLRYAFDREVKVLDLGFGSSQYDITKHGFPLPYFTWTCTSLVELRLSNCEIRLPDRVRTGLLRVLELRSVSLSLSKEVFDKIISSCPLLHDVVIVDCIMLNELSFTASNVKNLRVGMKSNCWKVLVNCPNVRLFEFFGYVDCVEIVNLSSLKVAVFNLNVIGREEFRAFVQFKRFLDRIQHAEVVKLNNEAFAVLTYRVVKNHPCPRNSWKHVVLNTSLKAKYISGICSLLRYSSFLEELTIYITDSRQEFELKLGYFNLDRVNCCSSGFIIQNLKNFTMHGLCRNSIIEEVELVKFVLENSSALEKLCILPKWNAQNLLSSSDLFDISKKMLTFPRASRQARVFFL